MIVFGVDAVNVTKYICSNLKVSVEMLADYYVVLDVVVGQLQEFPSRCYSNIIDHLLGIPEPSGTGVSCTIKSVHTADTCNLKRTKASCVLPLRYVPMASQWAAPIS